MALQRECLAFVPTIPQSGGPSLWFDEALEKSEDSAIIVSDTAPDDRHQAPVIPVTAGRLYITCGFTLGGVGDNGGWQTDGRFFFGAGAIEEASEGGLFDNMESQEIGRLGDGIIELEDWDQNPDAPTPAQSIAFTWRNSFGSPGFVEINEVTGNQIDVVVPWQVD